MLGGKFNCFIRVLSFCDMQIVSALSYIIVYYIYTLQKTIKKEIKTTHFACVKTTKIPAIQIGPNLCG